MSTIATSGQWRSSPRQASGRGRSSGAAASMVSFAGRAPLCHLCGGGRALFFTRRQKPPYLFIVIPPFRARRRLPATIAQLGEWRREFKRQMEVLIVVEQSPDGTLEI